MWNGASFGLSQTCLAPAVPQPTLRYVRLAVAATGFSSIRPAAASQPAVCQYAFSMAATASDPIRPSSQGVATVRYNESHAIGCSVWNVTNPFQRDSAIRCSIWNVTNRFQRHSATGYSTWNATSHFGVNTLNKTVSRCKLVPTPPPPSPFALIIWIKHIWTPTGTISICSVKPYDGFRMHNTLRHLITLWTILIKFCKKKHAKGSYRLTMFVKLRSPNLFLAQTVK